MKNLAKLLLASVVVVSGLAACVGDTPQLPLVTCTECGTECVDLRTDVLNCGACGKKCAAGEVCQAEKCSLSCADGTLKCGDKCVDPLTNGAFCGATADCAGANAGAICKTGESCQAGACKLGCASDRVVCEGNCIDPQTDRKYCGAVDDCLDGNAGEACPADQFCVAGQCECPEGQIVCTGKCTDPLTSMLHCGATGSCTGASNGTACEGDQVCVGGECKLLCAPGMVMCEGRCIDPLWDDVFCGADATCSTGVVCTGANRCLQGVCAPVPASCKDIALLGVLPTPETVTKECALDPYTYDDAPPSYQPCKDYCDALGYIRNWLSATPKSCSGSGTCDFVTDFNTCALGNRPNAGNCSHCSSSFICNCQKPSQGEFTLYWDGVPFRPYTAYCYDLDTAGVTPSTYLTLVNTGGDYNFAQRTAGGTTPGTDVRTSYTRVRFDPATRLVDIGDTRYSTTTGSIAGVGTVPYGTAVSCDGAETGKANVDLTGLPFKVVSTWSGGGVNPMGGATPSADGKVITVTGGGSCGWTNPGAALVDPNAAGSYPNLELAYSP